MWKPAKEFDVVEVIGNPYVNDGVEVGEKYVALVVYDGDYTVVSMNSKGESVRLCYPEEYRVIGSLLDVNIDSLWRF